MGKIDFGRFSDDYAAHRPGYPDSFYQRLNAIVPIRGCRSLDLATGPGIIALEMAARGSSVVGIDISENQVCAAERAARERHLEDRALFAVGRAEDTGLEAGAFDLAISGLSWHWFDAAAAMREVRRVLRPGGLLVIAYYTYLTEHSPVARETENLILKFHPSWNMSGWTGVEPERIDDLIRAGFRFVEAFCYDHEETFSHARWRGRIRTCSGVGSGGLSPSDVRRYDEALSRLLSDKFPEPLVIPHRVWCVAARTES